jgi:hypothetical protein
MNPLKIIASYFFKQGQVTAWGVIFFLTAGIAVAVISVEFLPFVWMRYLGISIGLALMAIGGFGARAGALGFKPFTNDPLGWRAAKKSYQDDAKDKEP